MFSKNVDYRYYLMQQRDFFLWKLECCLKEGLKELISVSWNKDKSSRTHTESTLVNWNNMSHSFDKIFSLWRQVFATVLCWSISTSLLSGTQRCKADSTISVMEFHQVATEHLMSLTSIFACVQQAARSSLRRGLWEMHFASFVI